MTNVNTKIKLKNVRLSFPNLFSEAVYNGEKTKFSATFLLPKERKDEVKAIIATIKQMTTEAKVAVSKNNLCIRDGDDIPYDGFAGHWSIKASDIRRPVVVNRDRTPLAEEDDVIYPGCYVNANIELWLQNNSYGKRVNANLRAVQFVEDGDSFVEKANAVDIEDEFEDL